MCAQAFDQFDTRFGSAASRQQIIDQQDFLAGLHGVFMHLNHEKRWVYGSLVLTVAFFVVLMLIPLLTTADQIGTPIAVPAAAGAAEAGHEGH